MTSAYKMTPAADVNAMIDRMIAGEHDIIPALQDAIEAGVSGAGKTVYVVVTEKAYKHFGKEYPAKRIPNAFMVIQPGESIRLVGLNERYEPKGGYSYTAIIDRTFFIGDTVKRDSFNLDYLDDIKAISAKAVCVENTNRNRKPDGSYPREVQDLAKFWRRNAHFDLNESVKNNQNWMD